VQILRKRNKRLGYRQGTVRQRHNITLEVK